MLHSIGYFIMGVVALIALLAVFWVIENFFQEIIAVVMGVALLFVGGSFIYGIGKLICTGSW